MRALQAATKLKKGNAICSFPFLASKKSKQVKSQTNDQDGEDSPQRPEPNKTPAQKKILKRARPSATDPPQAQETDNYGDLVLRGRLSNFIYDKNK